MSRTGGGGCTMCARICAPDRVSSIRAISDNSPPARPPPRIDSPNIYYLHFRRKSPSETFRADDRKGRVCFWLCFATSSIENPRRGYRLNRRLILRSKVCFAAKPVIFPFVFFFVFRRFSFFNMYRRTCRKRILLARPLREFIYIYTS